MLAKLVDCPRVERRELVLEVLQHLDGIVKAEAVAGPSQLEQHDGLLLAHRLANLE